MQIGTHTTSRLWNRRRVAQLTSLYLSIYCGANVILYTDGSRPPTTVASPGPTLRLSCTAASATLELTGPAAIPIGHVDGGDRHVSRDTPRQRSCRPQEERP